MDIQLLRMKAKMAQKGLLPELTPREASDLARLEAQLEERQRIERERNEQLALERPQRMRFSAAGVIGRSRRES